MIAAEERGQILILLAMWLFFGGGAASALVVYEHSVAHMKQGVKEVIVDPSRKEALLSYIKQWEYVYGGQSEKVGESRQELLAALRHKDTQRAQVEPIMAKLDQSFLVMDWDFLNLRFRVKNEVSGVEWVQIVAPSGSRKAQPMARVAASGRASREARCVSAAPCGPGAAP